MTTPHNSVEPDRTPSFGRRGDIHGGSASSRQEAVRVFLPPKLHVT